MELLYTLRRDQQILRHSQELDLYYVHDVSLNLYYPYRIQEVSKLPKAKRRTSGHTQDAEAKPLSRVRAALEKNIESCHPYSPYSPHHLMRIL